MRRALIVLALLLGAPGTASAATEITFGAKPATPRYGTEVVFSGVVTTNGAPVEGEAVDLIADTGSGWTVLGSTATQADGTYAFAMTALTPGAYAAQTQHATSAAYMLTLKPQLSARITGLRYPGSRVLLQPAKTTASS